MASTARFCDSAAPLQTLQHQPAGAEIKGYVLAMTISNMAFSWVAALHAVCAGVLREDRRAAG